MRQSQIIVSNAGVIWVSQALSFVPQLIMVPYLIKKLGENGYGMYVLVWSLFTSIEQFEKSLQSGSVKYCAEHFARQDMTAVNKTISSAFIYALLLAFVAGFGVFAAGAFYTEGDAAVQNSLRVLAVMLLLIIPITPYIAVIQSRQNYYVGAIAEMAAKYLALAMVVIWFHWTEPAIESLVIIMAGTLLASKATQAVVAHRLIPGLRNSPRLADRATFIKVATFGGGIVIASFCLAANSTGVRWLAGVLISASFVGHLAIMLMPALLTGQILGALTVTVMPAASGFQVRGDDLGQRQLLQRGTRYIVILGLCLLLAGSCLMAGALRFWVGAAYEFLESYAIVLLAGGIFMACTSVAHHMLKGLGMVITVIYIYATSLVLVPFSIILILLHLDTDPYWTITCGLVAGQFVCGIWQLLICAKKIGVEFRGLMYKSFVKPGGMATLAVLPLAGARLWGGDSVGIDILAAVATSSIFCVSAYYVLLSKQEKSDIRSLMHKSMLKLTARLPRKTSSP